VRGLDHRISGASQISVALIIRDYDHNIRLFTEQTGNEVKEYNGNKEMGIFHNYNKE
jgi:hypothetical protein